MRKTQTIRPAPWQRLTVKLTAKPQKLRECLPKPTPAAGRPERYQGPAK